MRIKIFFIFLIFEFTYLFSEEVFFLEKKAKNSRNELLSLNLNIIAETKNGFIFLKSDNQNLDGLNFKKIGDFYGDLYFVTPRYDNINLNLCGKVLFKEENLYIIEMDENSKCLKDNNLRLHRISMERLSPLKIFEKIDIEENIFVKDMLENFDENLAISEFLELVSYSESRYSTNAGCFSSTERAYNIFESLGLEVEYQNYSYTYAPNVIGKLKGLLEPEKVVILIAHIDDMPAIPPAPGANDNGSGSAMVINFAKILSDYRFSYTIKFILVTGEEQGLVGSSYYSAKAYKNNEDIIGVLNADMIGWEGDGVPTEEDLDLSYNENSEFLANLFVDVYNLYENIVPPKIIYCPTNFYSDHYSFWKRGYPAVMGITDNEGICFQKGSYPYYHTHNDTIENCGNLDFFLKTQRAYLAVLAHIAKPLCISPKNKVLNTFDFKYICPSKIK